MSILILQKNKAMFKKPLTKSDYLAIVFILFIAFYYFLPVKSYNKNSEAHYSISNLRSAIIMEASETEIEYLSLNLSEKLLNLKESSILFNLQNSIKKKDKKSAIEALNQLQNQIFK